VYVLVWPEFEEEPPKTSKLAMSKLSSRIILEKLPVFMNAESSRIK
jgi:hypothetical protein